MQDRKLTISTGGSAKCSRWMAEETTWPQLAARLAVVSRPAHTLAQYAKANAEERSRMKDGGGYVGGYLRGGIRKPANVGFRSILTLDLDLAEAGAWGMFQLAHGCAAVMHSTHSHTAAQPKFRLIIPLDRDVSSEEYEAIGRRVAGDVGIHMFDNTGFQTYRLMYWPSAPSDGEAVHERQDGPLLCADDVLKTYIDWRDTSLWPTIAKHDDAVARASKELGDPALKPGVVGEFCRAHDIPSAIDAYLSDVYEPAGANRYTYAFGSTSGGLVLYDGGAHAYSHHGTDPISGRMVNAYDLVRLHKFTDMSDKASDTAMRELALKDPHVARGHGAQMLANAQAAFSRPVPGDVPGAQGEEPTEQGEASDDAEKAIWGAGLERDKSGQNKPSAKNISLIVMNDKTLRDRFVFDEFRGAPRIRTAGLPWRKSPKPYADIEDKDLAEVRSLIEISYGISSPAKIADAIMVQQNAGRFHEVRDFLDALEWDGVPRAETLLIDFMGAEDSEYVRQVTRISLTAHVRRIYRPGCKYDHMVVLIGEQGTGKSTFLEKLALDWYSSHFMGVEGKEAVEQMKGYWLLEVAEMKGVTGRDADAVKAFLTNAKDTYRPPYAPQPLETPRQCIFWGTHNRANFLTDDTGNRRFLPVQTNTGSAPMSLWDEMTEDYVRQCWAEAVTWEKAGQVIEFMGDGKEVAKVVQSEHLVQDSRASPLAAWLDRLLPEDWDTTSIAVRKSHWAARGKGTVPRAKVCIAEIQVEFLELPMSQIGGMKDRDIDKLMSAMPGWAKGPAVFAGVDYGTAPCYIRI